MTMIADNLQRVRGRIEAACLEAGRQPSAVRFLAVSKTFDAAAVRTAFEAVFSSGSIAVQPEFNWCGENFWQKPYPNK